MDKAEDLKVRLKLIYLPFLFWGISIVIGYTFLYWLFFIKFSVLQPSELIEIWIPLILPFIPVSIWLLPRNKLLDFNKDWSKILVIVLLQGFTIAFSLANALDYLKTTTGKLTQLDNINQIRDHDATKYYSLKHFYIDKSNIAVFKTYESGAKILDMVIYIALPIFASESQKDINACIAWYGIRYYKRTGTLLSADEKSAEFRTFSEECKSYFMKENVNDFVYLERLDNIGTYFKYKTAIRRKVNYLTDAPIVLIPAHESFDMRTGIKFFWIFGAFGIGAFVFLLLVFIPSLDESAVEKFITRKGF